MLTIHLVRHGETVASLEHRFCGVTECELTERGRDLRDLLSWLRRRTGRRSWRVMEGGRPPQRPDRFN